MSDTFTKLASNIITSSIWSEDDKTRIVWITMLALCDKDGVVETSIPGLATVARVPIADTIKALEKLGSPDKFSRTEANEGRRIAKIEGGYVVLNYAKYRNRERSEERKKYIREYRRDQREKELTAESEQSEQKVNTSEQRVNRCEQEVNEGERSASASASKIRESAEREKIETKKPLGEFGKVKLTDAEYRKLVDKHGQSKADAGIGILDDWLARTGKRRNNHYACMKDGSWVWERYATAKGIGQPKGDAIEINPNNKPLNW